MVSYVVFMLLLGAVHADYDCLCNYNVEKSVYLSPSNQGQPIGYLYEFDCKQIIEERTSYQGWATVAFEHKIGYVEKDSQTNAQICPGEPPEIDIVTTTTTTAVTETTTFINTMSTTGKTSTSTTTTTPSMTTKPLTTPSTLIPTTTATTTSTTTLTTTPKMTSTTMQQTTTSQTTRSAATSIPTKSATSSATSQFTTTTTNDTSTTSSSGKLVCPLSVQQIAQAERSQVFVNANNGKCYELVTFKRAWSYAENDCKSKGGHLTSIENLNEDKWLYGNIQSYGDDTWIGFNDNLNEEHFEWTSGDAVAYTNWEAGHRDPSSHGSQDCVLIKASTGYWNDEGCGSFHAYICKFDAVIDNGTHITQFPTRTHTTPSTLTALQTTGSTASGKLSCPPDILLTAQSHGWSTFVSEDTRKCYELVEERRMWDNAENDCQRKGGHLATIESQSVEKLLYRYVQLYGHITWIGLHDQNREEHFEWSSGDPVTYYNWHPGRKDPDFHRFEDCVAMGTLTGTWEDMDCLYNYHAYICEFDAVLGGRGPLTSVDGDISLCPSTVRHLAERDNAIIGQYERGCYELMRNVKVSWQHGEDLCQSRGGHLAHIGNAQQQSFVQTFLNRHSPQHAVWIGLHDTKIEGAFQWTSGTAVAYTNWIPGHVSNFESFHTEDCVAFIPYKNGKWDDIPCGNEFDLGETHPILCQYKISLSPAIVG